MNIELRHKDGLKGGFKNYLIAAVMLVALCSLAIAGRAKISEKSPDIKGISTVDPNEFEPLRASVVDKNPAHYTIDVRKFSNIGVNEEAPYFSVYISESVPKQCGDFRDLDLPYEKPDKYKRTFNLSDQKEVLKAIDTYKCVVIRS